MPPESATSGAPGAPGAYGMPDGPAPWEPPTEQARAEAVADAERRRRDDLERRRQVSLDMERMFRSVRREIDAEEHAANWKRPTEYDSLAYELAMPEEPVTYRVERIIPTGANVVLTAQYKTGKTTMVNHLVKCLADGDDFLGKYPVQRLGGRVGIFNYEVGAAQYRRWLRDVGIERTDHVSMLHLRGLRLPMLVSDVEDYVVDWLKRHEVEFWILDPYARALIGSAEENDNSAVGRFLDTLDVVKERAGVTELFMPAHTGRAEQEAGQERARGATRIDDWPDVRWVMTKEKDSDRRYLKCTGRDVEEPEQALAYDEASRSLGAAGVGRSSTRRVGLEQELIGFISQNPGMGVNELNAAFPARRRDVQGAIDSLVQSGLVSVQIGRNNKKLHYIPTPIKAPPWEQPDLGSGIF
jgi:hypothetical protein